MITAYDYTSGLLCDKAGADILLVGDSVGMVVLGMETTVAVTMEDMLHHAKAVCFSLWKIPRLFGHDLAAPAPIKRLRAVGIWNK